jgi:4-amino-4-deoxy-L-arabinose transferase-like glycosyltransferase
VDVDVAGAPAGTGPAVHPFDRRVLAVGAVVFAILTALSTRYGFQRDELYFLDCARHLQLSYVDQPGLAPFLARVSLDLFGVSAAGMRIWSSLAAFGTVVVGGLTARELGGGRRAQLLAATGVATSPALWGSAHVANTTSYMVLGVAGLACVVARIGRTGEVRWWALGGVVLGLGVADNHLVGIFAVALVLGLLLSRGWRLLANWWFALGVAIAFVGELPDLWWNAGHGWATFAMTHALNQENGGLVHVPGWVLSQLILASPAMVWVWIVGLRRLWRCDRPAWRALAWAYGILFVVFGLTTGAKVYYLFGAYVYLLGAGAVAVEGWLFARRRRIGVLAGVTAVLTLLLGTAVLPVLPPHASMESTLAESVGWPQLVDTVRGVWDGLPPAQRAGAVIFTADYSEAAAINELGRGSGLPEAVSAHNTDWWWGPGNPSATTVVAVAPGPEAVSGYADYLRKYFTGVREAATLTNPYGARNIEAGGHVYVCTGMREPWSVLWPRLRHYD